MRHWLLAARRTRLRPFVDWGLRQPSPFRAMLPAVLGAVLNGTVAYLLVRAAAASLLALGTSLLKKEHKFRSSLDDGDGKPPVRA